MNGLPDAYDWIAGWYDTLLEPVLAGLRRLGLDMCPPRPGMTVLDGACGTGAHLQLYQSAGCKVHGIDLSQSMLSVARNRLGPTAPLHLADASRMPFADETFDLVLFSMALHEFAPGTRVAALEEARRVVKPEGRILVLDYDAGPASFPFGWWYSAAITCVEWLAGADHFRHQRRYLAAGGVPRLISRLGLAVEDLRVLRFGTFGLYLLRPVV